MLDIARIQYGRLSLSVVPMALGPLIHEVVNLLRPLAPRHGERP